MERNVLILITSISQERVEVTSEAEAGRRGA